MHKILFSIGPFTVYSYGFLVALAFLTVTLLVVRRAEKIGLERNSVLDLMLAVLIGGAIGGRLLFVILNWKDFMGEPLRMFMINEGGMAFHGSLIGGFIGGAVIVKLKKLPFWRTADLVSMYAPLGHAIGRIGCFLNGCCYGAVTDSRFGVIFPGDAARRIPAQLYSSFCLVLLFIALRLMAGEKHFAGFIFSMYIMLYSVYRFFIEFLRDDNPAIFLNLTLSQVISVALFGIGAVLFLALRPRKTS